MLTRLRFLSFTLIAAALIGCSPAASEDSPLAQDISAQAVEAAPQANSGLLVLLQNDEGEIATVDAAGTLNVLGTIPQVSAVPELGETPIADFRVFGGFNDAGSFELYKVSPDELAPLTLDLGGDSAFRFMVSPISGQIAWGSFSNQEDGGFSYGMYLADAEGSTRQTISEVTISAEMVQQAGGFVESVIFNPVGWSADGRYLYYSEEPYGLGSGGAIFYYGFSNLYSYDLETGETLLLLPDGVLPQLCLSDLSPQDDLLVHHCEGVNPAILNLETTESFDVVLPPAPVTYEQAGTSRFSPSGTKLAYTLSNVDIFAPVGAVAVVDDLRGPARIAAEAPAGRYFIVQGWLDEQTIIAQAYGPELSPELYLIDAQNGGAQLLAQGRFLGLMTP